MIIEEDGLRYHLVMQIMKRGGLLTFWRAYRGGEVIDSFWTWSEHGPNDSSPMAANDTGKRQAA